VFRGARHFVLLGLLLSALTACGLAETGLPASAPTQAANAEYTVKPGDTLAGIATRFHVTVQELVASNTDRYPTLAANPGLVRVGWQLRIPGESTVAELTPTAIGTPESQIRHADLDEAAQRIIEGVNAARAGEGLSLLRSDPTLRRIASERSADMISRGYFSHYDPQTGQEALVHDIQALHYTYQYAGENIAELKNDASWVPPLLTVAARYSAADLANQFVPGWLNSPEHRANILNPHYRRTGVGLAFSPDGRRIVATQIFSD
jgi:uncharacterized protein YkwD